MLKKMGVVLAMIKVQHTVFALPFALVGAIYAKKGWPTLWESTWLLAAMVSARSAAMAFNRAVDARFDAANPRTRIRAIPQGHLSLSFTYRFTAAMAALFVFSAAMLNSLVALLAPGALLITLGYSFTKRITPLCHFVLGLGLALAPSGAWLAIRPEFHTFPALMSGVVLFWVAGFDILYACEDVDFDRRTRLYSIPAWLGISRALVVSAGCHGITVILLVVVLIVHNMGGWFVAGVAIIALLLGYEHALVRPHDLRRVNTAFFHVNAAVSLTIGTAALFDLML